jgi:RNA polymerase sigma-32 factor
MVTGRERSKGEAPTPERSEEESSTPEVIIEDAPEDEDLEDDDTSAFDPAEGEEDDDTAATRPAAPASAEKRPGGTVVDVSSGPTLPSLPSAGSPSVPALRARGGLNRKSALDAFLAEMGKYPVLSSEEERELTTAYYERQDPAAARKLVVHNLRLVVKMAYRYRRAWASVLDLIQEGNVGLVEAVQRFDPFKGAKFSTYATFWIRAYMLRYLLENSRTVRISRTRVGRKLFFQLSRERAKLRAMGIEPGAKLLADRLGVDEGELEEVVKHMDQAEVRLDAPIGDDGSTGTVLDTLHAESQSPEVEAFKSEFASSVTKALDAFAETLTDEREKRAWEAHLMSDDPKSLSELGAEFGVTKQRMGQIVSGLRKRLKKHLVSTLGPDVELGFQFDEV